MAATARVTPIKPAFVIETGVPRVAVSRSYATKPKSAARLAIEALSHAAPGASIFFPAGSVGSKDVTAALTAYARIVGGSGWASVRRVDGGYRVWKIAEL